MNHRKISKESSCYFGSERNSSDRSVTLVQQSNFGDNFSNSKINKPHMKVSSFVEILPLYDDSGG